MATKQWWRWENEIIEDKIMNGTTKSLMRLNMSQWGTDVYFSLQTKRQTWQHEQSSWFHYK